VAIESTTRPSEVIDADELDLAPPDEDGGQGEELSDDYEESADDTAAESFDGDYAEDEEASQPAVTAEVGANGDSQAMASGSKDGSGPPPPTGDPFLDELRRVTTEEPGAGDPITDFLEEDNPNRGGGWFGRRK
ncbi:MAG: hypothetical protein OEV40_26520, partial [Acidimicrobiia bacterium]|nr:hypothetical protein [Acidimicrobiia bacterium]